MNKAHSFIIDENGILQSMGDGLTEYLDLKRNNVEAYPPGAIKKGDMILFVETHLELLKVEEKDLFQSLGMEMSEKDRGILFACVYDNAEIQPICKTIRFSQELAGTLLDTCFEGNDMKISYDGKLPLLSMVLGEQLIEECLQSGDNLICCFHEDGIKYFAGGTGKRAENLEALLKGQDYQGFIKEQAEGFKGRQGKETFTPEFWKSVESIQAESKGEDSNFGIGACHGKNFYLFRQKIELLGKRYEHYTVFDKEDILQSMSAETEYYRALVKEENKHSNATMASGFRLWGNDAELLKVKGLLQKACGTGISILLTGESGTGKTFLAKEIHKNSKRSDGPFIHVNCAAIPYQLIESELFGYEEGAFTGAKKGGKKGYFELARRGTIFLDEITEMPLGLQGKLLEVIQSKTFYRVGGSEKISTDIRLIAATNRNLKEQVAAKEFREDLYYRINVFPIELPPLRKRAEALPEIINDVLPRICNSVEIEPLVVSGQAMVKMKQYSWPGNIRELENVLSKAAILCDGKMILPEDIELQEEVGEKSELLGITLKEQKEYYEKRIIEEALKRCSGEKGKTAEYLGIGRTNLFEKIRKYNLEYGVEE